MSEDTDHTGHPQPMSRAELFGVFAFWTVLAVLTAANRLADQREPALSVVSRTVPVALAFQQMYTWALLTPFVFWLAGRFSIDKSNALPRLALLLAIGVVVAFSVDRLNSSLVRAFHVRPGWAGPASGGASGTAPGSGGFFSILHGPMILNHFILYIGVLSAGIARDYFFRYRSRELETARLQGETARLEAQLAGAKLDALKAERQVFRIHVVGAVKRKGAVGERNHIVRSGRQSRVLPWPCWV